MTAILAVWNDCAAAGRKHYERWYNREHLLERVGVPGFRWGRRFESAGETPRYFTFYEVDDAAVLTSPAYLARLDAPTVDTRKAMASFQGMVRCVFDIAATAGVLTGAHAVTLRFSDPFAKIADLAPLIASLAKRDGVAKAQLWTKAATETPSTTTEMKLRAGPDRSHPAALLVECVRRSDAEAVLAALQTEPAFAALLHAGQRQKPHAAIYSFLCAAGGQA